MHGNRPKWLMVPRKKAGINFMYPFIQTKLGHDIVVERLRLLIKRQREDPDRHFQ
jgi:hypothetical protein